MARSIAHSLPFGLYHGARQVGFARAITDRATFAYLGDVFALDEYQGRGLGKWLVECVVAHPDLQDLRRWSGTPPRAGRWRSASATPRSCSGSTSTSC